ncbi:molybdenum cofactor guanylyltransferase [Geomonas agri]|uniref:molybdenum cofactor guanylyltransferase n=1 Tax=Geomonas agri TaxID=2873702 RepID=UPI001CD7D042|nr:molybdenum cofactor guanylyltransferase [Geomonas agri]
MKRSRPIAFPDVTGVILAGGQSSRMGSNKALLPYGNGLLIDNIHRLLAPLFGEMLIAANDQETYAFVGCRVVPDRYRGLGALSGLHAALAGSRTPYIFAVACDMPFLDLELIRALVALRHEADVVIPEGDMGPEPLHAVYATACLPQVEAALQENRRRMVSFFPAVRVLTMAPDRVAAFDPTFASFCNVNTPAEYFALRGRGFGALATTDRKRC